MSRETKLALGVFLAALALGITGDALFQDQSLGINVVLWLALALILRDESASGWPSWNLSRRRAAHTLAEHRADLARLAVPAP